LCSKSQGPENGRHITTKDQRRKNGFQHLYTSQHLFLCLLFPHFSSLSASLFRFLSLPLPSQLPFFQLLSSFVSRCRLGNHPNLLLPILLKPRTTFTVWLSVSFCEKYDYNGTSDKRHRIQSSRKVTPCKLR